MWLSLIILLLLLAVALVQSKYGLFNALIMTVLTLCCAAAALGLHEWIAVNWLAPVWKPDYAMAIALGATFGIPLIALRALFDKVIRRSCLLPGWIDRIGGGFCAAITAMVMVGLLAHALQNLPFGTSVMGFSRVNVPPKEKAGDAADAKAPALDAPEGELWLAPDRFAIGTVSVLSAGIFSGERLLATDHPDLVQAVGWVNAVHPDVSRIAGPKSVSIARTAPVSFVYDFKPGDPRRNEEAAYDPAGPKAGHEFRMIRVALGPDARDTRKSHLFSLRQFRLVGRQDSGQLVQFRPVAIQQEDAAQPTNRHVRTKLFRNQKWPIVDDLFVPRDDGNQVEVVFELPTGFKPTYLEYKRGARVAVSFDKDTEKPPPPDAGSPKESGDTEVSKAPAPPKADGGAAPERGGRRRRGSAPAGDTVPSSGQGGNVRGVTTRQGGSVFGDELPLPLRAYRAVKAPNLTRGRLSAGHLVGEVEQQEAGKEMPITNFDVPKDKRLLQLSTTRLHTRSGLGRALDFAASTVQNYFVEDSNGQRYTMNGKCAIADVEGTRMVEVQYFAEPAGTVGGVGPFDKIKDSHLNGDYELILLFLVDPGSQIVAFSTGGAATRQDDLREENLVAPD